MKRAVITVVGKDTVGIIAKVCTYLANENVNILDISQTILKEFFNMIMIVDISNAGNDFVKIANGLEELGNSMGLVIRIQREDIFDMMHRI
ncbi:MAG: ACT domain-containing protein [Lachnospiraceae bacterium]|nr:ACT domain-containing protein [Lachnospiraceae bacterium]